MDFRTTLLALAKEDPQRRVKTISLAELTSLGARFGTSLPDTARDAVESEVFPASLLKNTHSLDAVAQKRLLGSTVLLVGVGGLGGYVLELLVRFGVGRILVADGDVFEESNLNRQLVSSISNLGRNKAVCSAERAGAINPLVRVEALDFFLDDDNATHFAAEADVVVDALGGIAPRAAVHAAADAAGKPIISAAVAGWTALVGSERPGVKGISQMWGDASARDAEHVLGSLAPAACLCASLQAAETVQFLIGGTLQLQGRMLHVDLATFSFQLYDMA